jgi:hypothetical protein
LPIGWFFKKKREINGGGGASMTAIEKNLPDIPKFIMMDYKWILPALALQNTF